MLPGVGAGLLDVANIDADGVSGAALAHRRVVRAACVLRHEAIGHAEQRLQIDAAMLGGQDGVEGFLRPASAQLGATAIELLLRAPASRPGPPP